VSQENGSVAEASWDEDKLAALVGLAEPDTELDSPVTPEDSNGNVIQQSDLFDEPAPDPRANKSKQPLAKNPYWKLGFVALGLSAVFGIGGFVMTTITSSKPVKKPVGSSPNPTPSVVIEKKETDEGRLKTQLALSTQAEELKGLDEKPDRKKEKVKPSKEPSQPSPSPSPSSVQPSAINRAPVAQPPTPPRPQSVYSPQRERMVYNRQPDPAPLPVPSLLPPPPVEASPPPPPPTQTQPPVTKEPEEQDQTEQWAVLASLGSYGQVVWPEKSEVQGEVAVQPTGWTGQVIQVGTVVTGEIAVPLAIPEDGKGQRFVVQLTDNLLDVDGQVALAEGQFLVFEVEGVDGSGLVSAKAISVVDEQGNERTIASAFSLENDGRPLVAQKLFDIGSDVASMDFGMVALGAISKMGEIMNRPKQQSSTSTSGSSTSTSSTSVSRDPNLLGAIMEGGAAPVLESISKRNEEAIERMQDQDNAWVLSPGTKIQIRVTQPLRI
jgi:hypothetical protein